MRWARHIFENENHNEPNRQHGILQDRMIQQQNSKIQNDLFEDWKAACVLTVKFSGNTSKDVRLCATPRRVRFGFSIEINEQICFTLNLRSKTKAEHKNCYGLSFVTLNSAHNIISVQSHPEWLPTREIACHLHSFNKNIVPMERTQKIWQRKVRARVCRISLKHFAFNQKQKMSRNDICVMAST